MKIVNDLDKKNIDKPEIEQVVREKKEYSILGTYSITKGLTLFAYNSIKNTIRIVEIKKGEFIQCELVRFKDGHPSGEWVYFDPENYNTTIDSKDIYFESLNMTNAKKRVNKFKNGKIKELFNLKKPTKSSIDFFKKF